MANSTKEKAAQYLKLVQWSDEDGCYVGTCPGLFLGGCHGDDESEVYKQLCQIAEDVIDVFAKDGTPLPPPTLKKYDASSVRVNQQLARYRPPKSVPKPDRRLQLA